MHRQRQRQGHRKTVATTNAEAETETKAKTKDRRQQIKNREDVPHRLHHDTFVGHGGDVRDKSKLYPKGHDSEKSIKRGTNLLVPL